jgi:preprotein translocase subunit YajC
MSSVTENSMNGMAHVVLLGQQWQREMLSMWLPLILIGVFFYMLMLGPERRKRKQHELLLQQLKQNDKVVTIGGIQGTVVNASKGSEFVTIRVDDNARLKVLRSAIARVEIDDKENKGSEKS